MLPLMHEMCTKPSRVAPTSTKMPKLLIPHHLSPVPGALLEVRQALRWGVALDFLHAAHGRPTIRVVPPHVVAVGMDRLHNARVPIPDLAFVKHGFHEIPLHEAEAARPPESGEGQHEPANPSRHSHSELLHLHRIDHYRHIFCSCIYIVVRVVGLTLSR